MFKKVLFRTSTFFISCSIVTSWASSQAYGYTDVLNVGANEFLPTNSGEVWISGPGASYDTGVNPKKRLVGYPSNTVPYSKLIAPIYLRNGVKVTQTKCTVEDNSSSSFISVELIRYLDNDPVAMQFMGTSDYFASYLPTTISSPQSFVVDNMSGYQYALVAVFSAVGNGNMSIVNCAVSYSYGTDKSTLLLNSSTNIGGLISL
jgi:hypothetical protein